MKWSNNSSQITRLFREDWRPRAGLGWIFLCTSSHLWSSAHRAMSMALQIIAVLPQTRFSDQGAGSTAQRFTFTSSTCNSTRTKLSSSVNISILLTWLKSAKRATRFVLVFMTWLMPYRGPTRRVTSERFSACWERRTNSKNPRPLKHHADLSLTVCSYKITFSLASIPRLYCTKSAS